MATLFDKLKRGLSRTRASLTEGLRASLGRGRLDEDAAEQIERLLIEADVGVEATDRLLDRLREAQVETTTVEDILRLEMRSILAGGETGVRGVTVESSESEPLLVIPAGHTPHVIMFVGVNGVGKTTTIGKVAQRLAAEGRAVLLGSCDTFRAAAGEQLDVWAQRAGAQILRQKDGADPASVAFDAVASAQSKAADVVLLDTAGRLHNKANLMEELRKIQRVVARRMPGAPHEVLLCLDATTGQNGIRQAREFHKVLGITGLVLTKLDGTARGGILVALAAKFGLPVHAIGVGEGIDDLQPFDAEEFAKAIAGSE